MNTNFDRQRAQLRCENILGCSTLEQWKIADFKSLRLNKSQSALLLSELREDSKDLYFKGLLSLFEALKSIHLNLFSWATVKIYYSLYYFLKCSLAINGVALIRQKSLYYLKAVEGEEPVKKGHKKYNTDHSGTINYFIDLFSSDILLSQNIENTNVYEWIMNKREQINYRERKFNEPNHSNFWDFIATEVKNGNLEKILIDYIEDEFILCFQDEHAILAIPIKRAILTRRQMEDEGIGTNITNEQKEIFTNLLPVEIPQLLDLIN